MTTKKIVATAKKQTKVTSNGTSKLVAGHFRPKTAIAELYLLLTAKKGKPVTLKAVDAIDKKTNMRTRLQALRRILAAGKQGKIEVNYKTNTATLEK